MPSFLFKVWGWDLIHVNWFQCKPMVEAGLLLQNSDFIPVHRVVVAPCVLRQCWICLVSRLHWFSTPSGAPSYAYPGTSLSGLHKKPGNLHMGPGTQLLPALLWGSDPLVLLVVIWGWCCGGKRPSILVESGLATPLQTDRAHMGGWPLIKQYLYVYRLCSHLWIPLKGLPTVTESEQYNPPYCM